MMKLKRFCGLSLSLTLILLYNDFMFSSSIPAKVGAMSWPTVV